MDDERIRKLMRAMAWERAKGELMSIKHGYYGEAENFQEFTKAVEDFIELIESNEFYA